MTVGAKDGGADGGGDGTELQAVGDAFVLFLNRAESQVYAKVDPHAVVLRKLVTKIRVSVT